MRDYRYDLDLDDFDQAGAHAGSGQDRYIENPETGDPIMVGDLFDDPEAEDEDG